MPSCIEPFYVVVPIYFSGLVSSLVSSAGVELIITEFSFSVELVLKA